MNYVLFWQGAHVLGTLKGKEVSLYVFTYLITTNWIPMCARNYPRHWDSSDNTVEALVENMDDKVMVTKIIADYSMCFEEHKTDMQ